MGGTAVKHSPETRDSQSLDSILLGERVAREYQVARVRLLCVGGSWAGRQLSVFLFRQAHVSQTNVTSSLGISFMPQHHQ
jgi:hypothetical protein